MQTHSPIRMLAAVKGLRASRSASLRVLKVIVALVSLSTMASCTQSPLEPVRSSAQQIACVSRNVLPRDAKTSYCDQDDLEEERDQKRHKKAAEQNLPN